MLLAIVLVAALGFWLLRDTQPPASPRRDQSAAAPPVRQRPLPPRRLRVCAEAPAFAGAAAANAVSLSAMPVTGFGRTEIGWETYAPLIAREVGVRCGPYETGFAAALATWQRERRLPVDGVLSPAVLEAMRVMWHRRRPVVAAMSEGCPGAPSGAELEVAEPEEGYAGKRVMLRPAALAAYRAMVAAARAESAEVKANPRLLTIFSAYRGPAEEAGRCAPPNVCDGRIRASCSPHRTGLAVDLHVGSAPGMDVASSADDNRLHQSRNPAYRWLVENADRFGFVPYPFEPWHWEWTGEPLRPVEPWALRTPAAPPSPTPAPSARRAPG